MIAKDLRIAVLDDYTGSARRILERDTRLPGAEIVSFSDHAPGPDALVERLRDFDVVIATRERSPFPAEVIARLPRLRLIVSTGMRNLAIDVAAARAAGITVCGTGSLLCAAVELTWALILAVVRSIPTEDASVRSGGWQRTAGTCLGGKTLGIVGLGKIGTRVGEIARAFGMEVVAWSPHLTAERASAGGARQVDKAELCRTADVVTIHMVLGETTRALVTETDLRAMKPTAYLINTSRGPIVDQPALLRALREGWISGAGIDVYDEEPLPPDHPMRSAPRTVLTPHVGYSTEDNFAVYYSEAVEDILAWLAGTPVRELV